MILSSHDVYSATVGRVSDKQQVVEDEVLWPLVLLKLSQNAKAEFVMAEICISRDHEFNPQPELSSSDPSIAVVSYCEIIFICFVYFVGRTIYQFNIAQNIPSL